MKSTSTNMTHPATILFTEELSPGIFLIGFKRTFDFIAGQVIGIAIKENDARRLYSICSGEKEDEIWILYKRVEEGYLTPQLSDLEAGARIWVTAPGGEFTGDGDPAVWIASGTGIAPFYSMLRSGLGDNKILLHGNRYLEQFHFYDEFHEALGDHYVRCCTGETDDRVYPGRVTDYLKEQQELDPTLKYYLCGSADMVIETRDILISKGIPFGHIISEIYF